MFKWDFYFVGIFYGSAFWNVDQIVFPGEFWIFFVSRNDLEKEYEITTDDPWKSNEMDK